MSRTTMFADPITRWPDPAGRMSSLSIAANRLWRRAELFASTGDGTSPMWLMDGALAYSLDLLEDLRRSHRLPLDSQPQAIVPLITATSLVEVDQANPGRARFIVQLLDYVNEQAEARLIHEAVVHLTPDQQAAIIAATKAPE